MSAWYNSDCGGIAVSTRIRIARNLEGVPFPCCMSGSQMKQTNERITEAVMSGGSALAKQLRVIEMDKISDEEARAMVERHIISPGFARKRENRVLILSEDESISIMLGEEDHIRIQVIGGGMCLNKAYGTADHIDTLIGERLTLAFDDTLGFLTECPTNLGTGLRASVMLHLPGIESAGGIRELADTVSKIGLTVRGLYGEGSNAAASLYQLSNQITLGISEKAALENLKTITTQIIEKEKAVRAAIDRTSLEDTVFRALGTLQNARKMSSAEMMGLLSQLKLGVDEGILTGYDANLPLSLLIEAQPGMLEYKIEAASPEQRDKMRADMIRQKLSPRA